MTNERSNTDPSNHVNYLLSGGYGGTAKGMILELLVLGAITFGAIGGCKYLVDKWDREHPVTPYVYDSKTGKWGLGEYVYSLKDDK
jgi:hypothetical protein